MTTLIERLTALPELGHVQNDAFLVDLAVRHKVTLVEQLRNPHELLGSAEGPRQPLGGRQTLGPLEVEGRWLRVMHKRAEGAPIGKAPLPATIEDDAVRFDLFLDPFQQLVDASFLDLECENERPREA